MQLTLSSVFGNGTPVEVGLAAHVVSKLPVITGDISVIPQPGHITVSNNKLLFTISGSSHTIYKIRKKTHKI